MYMNDVTNNRCCVQGGYSFFMPIFNVRKQSSIKFREREYSIIQKQNLRKFPSKHDKSC